MVTMCIILPMCVGIVYYPMYVYKDKFTEKILKSFKPTTYQRQICTDQGGELAISQDFQEMIAKHNYIIEPTGAYTPEQNGMAEPPN